MTLLKFVFSFLLTLSITSQSFATHDGIGSELSDIDCDQTPFVEKDGIIVVEVESVNISSGWTKASNIAGFTGNGYFRRDGADRFNSPGNGLLQYKIYITNPGTYHFRWYNKIMIGTSKTDSNDSWLRIPDADDFFAKKGTSVKYPKGGKFIQSNVVTEGSSSSGWMKVYCSGTTNWTWSCRTSDSDAHEIYASFSKAGVYTVQISGRSKGHAIDRFVLFQDAKYSVSQATNKALKETRCVNTGANEVNVDDAQISLYQNPEKKLVIINNMDADEIAGLKVIDLTGKTILTAKTSIGRGDIYQLSMEAFQQNGMYLIHMTTVSGKLLTQKIFLKN